MIDWDDAFDNVGHVPNALGYFETWQKRAQEFRESGVESDLDLPYGTSERQKVDIFWPREAPKGLVVFVHGGYWIRLDRSYFSDLAAGPLETGWAVAMPSYTLAPDAKISEITREIAQAVTFVTEKITGPIRLAGHSAGGHLVTRMICVDSPLGDTIQNRIVKTVSISGVHDLRNLCKTALNETLKLTEEEAILESPSLNLPIEGANVTAWAGSAERPEFVSQNQVLHDAWAKHGVKIDAHLDEGRHHFDVIDGLKNSNTALCRKIMG